MTTRNIIDEEREFEGAAIYGWDEIAGEVTKLRANEHVGWIPIAVHEEGVIEFRSRANRLALEVVANSEEEAAELFKRAAEEITGYEFLREG